MKLLYVQILPPESPWNDSWKTPEFVLFGSGKSHGKTLLRCLYESCLMQSGITSALSAIRSPVSEMWRLRFLCFRRRVVRVFFCRSGISLCICSKSCFIAFTLCYLWSVFCRPASVHGRTLAHLQGSHASWKVLESPGFFFLKIPGPGKSWKITLVLESPGKISSKVVHFSSGSNGKQAAIV